MPSILFHLSAIDPDLLNRISSAYARDAVLQSAAGFRSNVQRIESPLALVLEVCQRASDFTVATVETVTRYDDYFMTPPEGFEEWMDQLLKDSDIPKKLIERAKTPVVQIEHARNLFRIFAQFISADSRRAVLASMIVSGWTAMEVLMEDLWERALNEHPNILSNVKIPDRDKRGLEVRSIEELGFDLRNKMGTLLKSKFKFHTLGETRLAYSGAFSANGEAVQNATNNKHIDALFHLRNIIAHNNGVIDAHFLEETKTISPLRDIRALGINAQIQFTGPMVSQFIGEAIKCGCVLLRAVDDWLTAHQVTQ